MDGSAERWLPIPDFPGYEVSDLGRVRSWRKFGTPFKDGRRFTSQPRLLSMRIAKNGYRGAVWPDETGRLVGVYVHRLVMLAFVGPLPEGQETRHLNGDKLDNRLVNLAYGTHSENIQDAVTHGANYGHAGQRTHCKNGHPFDEANTYWWRGRRGIERQCRQCHRDYRKRKALARAG